MGFFNRKNKEKTKCENTNNANNRSFVSFVLLSEIEMDFDQLVKDLHDDWNINIRKHDICKDKGCLVTKVNGMMLTVSLIPAPIPNGEAIENAKTNFRWADAVNVAEAHKAHVLVSLQCRNEPMLDSAVMYVKVCASCLKQPHATGINTLGSVLAPDFYRECAKGYIDDGNFPILNLVFFGIYSRDEGKTTCGYTYGMDAFGKKEIEVIDSSNTPGKVFAFITTISSYVIEDDVLLQDGETIGFTAEQKLPIIESTGVAIEGTTLKIGF